MQKYVTKYWKAWAALAVGVVGEAIVQGLISGTAAEWASIIIAAVAVPVGVIAAPANKPG